MDSMFKHEIETCSLTTFCGLLKWHSFFWVKEGCSRGISALKPMYCNESDFVCLKLIKAIASGWPRANKRQNASSCIDLGPPQHRRVLRAWSTFMATLGFLWILCTALGHHSLYLLSHSPLALLSHSFSVSLRHVCARLEGVCRSFSLDWAISNWALSKRPQADG